MAGTIAELIRPTIDDMGYRLVRVLIQGRQRQRVQIMIERLDGAPMQVDDCALVSRAISAVLDVDDPLPGPYTLEVSSPGIDRPLVELEDYDRFASFEARIELARPINGRRRLQGRLRGVEGDAVSIDIAGDIMLVPFADIQRAKLVLTDDLLASQGAPVEKMRAEI